MTLSISIESTLPSTVQWNLRVTKYLHRYVSRKANVPGSR